VNIEEQLVQSLDKPEHLWQSMLSNFPSSTQMSILVLPSCATPVDLVAWQAAVSKVDTSASTHFEQALRTLDDMFITIKRPPLWPYSTARRTAEFRNPSIEEFCVQYLNNNAGVVNTILTSSPTFVQVDRVLTLGFSRIPATRDYQYPNIAALLRRPGGVAASAITRFLRKRPEGFSQVVASAIDLYLELDARTRRAEAEMVEQCRALLLRIDFSTPWHFKIVDYPARVRMLPEIMSDELQGWYHRLVESADKIADFESLTTFESALIGSRLQIIDWRAQFEACIPADIESFTEYSDADTARQNYYQVLDYLGDDVDGDLDDLFTDALGHLAPEHDDFPRQHDSTWRPSGHSPFPPSSGSGAKSAPLRIDDDEIHAMFESFLDR
jgi:hypothetical protein